MTAQQEARGQQRPEPGIAPAPFMQAEQCPKREGRARQRVKPFVGDHWRALPNRRSKARMRPPWIKKAQMAVGIAQTESCNGVMG